MSDNKLPVDGGERRRAGGRRESERRAGSRREDDRRSTERRGGAGDQDQQVEADLREADRRDAQRRVSERRQLDRRRTEDRRIRQIISDSWPMPEDDGLS